MVIIRVRGDETRNRILHWSEAQKASERFAGHILAADEFTSKDLQADYPDIVITPIAI